jgi:hypothetical protein
VSSPPPAPRVGTSIPVAQQAGAVRRQRQGRLISRSVVQVHAVPAMLVAGFQEPHVYFEEKPFARWHVREQRGRRPGARVVLDELPISLAPVAPVHPPGIRVRGCVVRSVECVAERRKRAGRGRSAGRASGRETMALPRSSPAGRCASGASCAAGPTRGRR